VDTNWATTGSAYYGAPPPLSDGGPDFRSLYVLGRYYHTVQFVSSNVSAYSARVQGSLDGLVWTDLAAGATSSDAIVSFTGLYKYLRLHATTITLSGGPSYTSDYGLKVIYIGVAQL